MRIARRLLIMAWILFASLLASAQTGNEVSMADTMRSNGRIYVVVAVIVTILLGLFLYLFRLDRKISRAEKNM